MAYASALDSSQSVGNRKSGWTAERRARQAMRIRIWAPWAKSTGPKTAAGKAKSSRNSYKHGGRSISMHLLSQRLSAYARFLRGVRAYVRARKIATNELLDAQTFRTLCIEGFAVCRMLNEVLCCPEIMHNYPLGMTSRGRKGADALTFGG